MNISQVILHHLEGGLYDKYLINSTDRVGNTPLHVGARLGHFDIVRVTNQLLIKLAIENINLK